MNLAMKIGKCLSDEKYSQSTSRVEVENQNNVQTKHGSSGSDLSIQNGHRVNQVLGLGLTKNLLIDVQDVKVTRRMLNESFGCHEF